MIRTRTKVQTAVRVEGGWEITLVGSDGKPEKYPTKISVNVEEDDKGSPAAYPIGEYTLSTCVADSA